MKISRKWVMPSIWTFSMKPVKILFDKYKVGDIVLDPFSGTGTTALAAKKLGRNYIGLELDEEYVRMSENKLKMENPDSKIGDVWVSFYLDRITTIRDLDWEKLSSSYVITEPIAHIDHTPIKSKNGKNHINFLELVGSPLLCKDKR